MCRDHLRTQQVYASLLPSLGAELPIEIGRIEASFRYPVKSMRGDPLVAATLGWHGLEGGRRPAFRRLDERGGLVSDCEQAPRPYRNDAQRSLCDGNLDPDGQSPAPNC
jgi:hypothetical protein